MKRLKIFLLAAIALINISCENAFEPKANFQEKYVLYSIIEKNMFNFPAKYSARIFRLYDVDGYDPMENKTDPTIEGAIVILEHNNQKHEMEQDTLVRRDTSRYNTPIYYYITKDAFAIYPGDKMRIIAKLPNGTQLSSEMIVSKDLNIQYSYNFPRGLTTNINTFTFGNKWSVYWDGADINHLFFPRLKIFYQKFVDSSWVNRSIEVPTTYKDGKPVYVDYTFKTEISYDFSALDQAMHDISGDDPVKENYKVTGAILEIMDYNEPLTKYFSSINGSLDAFSVRLDETVYTNIGGGIGVFGSFIRNQREFTVDAAYIKSFGYVY